MRIFLSNCYAVFTILSLAAFAYGCFSLIVEFMQRALEGDAAAIIAIITVGCVSAISLSAALVGTLLLLRGDI